MTSAPSKSTAPGNVATTDPSASSTTDVGTPSALNARLNSLRRSRHSAVVRPWVAILSSISPAAPEASRFGGGVRHLLAVVAAAPGEDHGDGDDQGDRD